MKRVFYSFLVCFITVQAHSQWIVNAGSSFTTFTAKGSTTGVGVYLGGLYDLNIFTDDLYLRPGLIYHYDRATADVLGSYKMAFDMHYLKLPVLFSYHFKLNENNSLNPYLGGYIYCGLYGKFTSKYDWDSITNTTTYDELERLNYGLTGGLEYEFRKHYLLHVEYNIGLNNVQEKNTSGGYPDYLKKINSLSIGIGYKF